MLVVVAAQGRAQVLTAAAPADDDGGLAAMVDDVPF
jgi:hypothetical protein